MHHPNNPPFIEGDLVTVKKDIWYNCPNGREYLTFRKGEVLKVRGCWFFSRWKGWEVAFCEPEKDERDSFFWDYQFQLKSEFDKEMTFLQKIIKRIFG